MERKNTVLVVDDVQENVQVISNILFKEGYNLVFAKDGKQAVNIAVKKYPDLILMDITMPEMDGFTACKMLKEESTTKEIPLIFLTASSQIDDIVEGFKIGAVDYVTKPFNSEELLIRVKNHIELKESRDIIKRKNKELKELNAAKDKFFRIIGHDLKSPISQVIQFSQLIEDNIETYTDEELKEFVFYMKDSSIKSLKLLENLLEWARSQTNNISFNPETVSLNSLVRENIDLLKKSAGSKHIHLINNISEPSEVLVDKNMISTVIRNLISNAIKFTYAEGIIEVGTLNDNGLIKVYIKDNGLGIPEEDRKKLLRIDSGISTLGTNNEKGTGIGLLLCKEFIDRHKGEIWVESETNKGSTFWFSLHRKKTRRFPL